MGRKKYTAPDNPKKWVPILKKNTWKNDCKYAVLSKVLCGCIHPDFIKDWNSESEKFINSCKECKNYEKKPEEQTKQKKRATKRVKKQEKKGTNRKKE